MTETWTDDGNQWAGNDYNIGNEYHYVIYHYFGDPTTRMWTDVPKTITANLSDTISINATNFPLNNVNAIGGIVTLYDKSNKTIIGKCIIENNKFNIPVSKPLSSIGNAVTMTITGQNYRPFIKEILIGNKNGSVSVNNINLHSTHLSVKIKKSTLLINSTIGKSVQIKIFDSIGRTIFNSSLNKENTHSKIFSINLEKEVLSHGLYFISINSVDMTIYRKFVY